MIPGPLLIRADAGVAMGAGHVMRCLALAQAWQDAGGRAIFVMAGAPAAIGERLRAESSEVVCIAAQPGTEADSRETIRLARAQNADLVVVDGYQFESEYQRLLKAAGLKVLFIDDYGHAQHYFADVVLNQNAADEALYQSREPYTRLLLGPRYCMLRREFGRWRDWKREIPKVGRRVLVTMGGSDPENVTARVIQALSLVKHEGLAAMVVIGGSNPHFEALQSAAGQKGITLRTNVSNMAELMAEADVAISAAGSTCWELCLLGLPALLIDVAENQKVVARELGRRGCAIHLGDLESASATRIADQLEKLLESQDLRRSLSQLSRELVDGGGARRVASILRGNCGLRIRPARQYDARMLWEWANDPEVRAASFTQAFIPWETHVAWFAKKLRDQQCFIFVGEDEEGKSVGQIRFDPTPDGDFEIGISVAKASRGRGLASLLIKLGVGAVYSKVGEKRIHAFVRSNNQASINAFEKAGFRKVGDTDVRGNAAFHLISEPA